MLKYVEALIHGTIIKDVHNVESIKIFQINLPVK